MQKHDIKKASNIFSKDAFETFPTFSPDGKTLYFCTAEARPIPQEYSEVKYYLCSVSFAPVPPAIGALNDTLYNAKSGGMSASFPRVSPDGRYLLYTLSGYGNFSIWHKDADLYILDEPNAALDAITEYRLSVLYKELLKKKKGIIVAHKFNNLVKQVDDIIVLEHGEITGIGSHENLLKTNETYKTLYEMQVG